jgi:hypothetical protein
MSTQAAPRRITRIAFLVSIAILLFSFVASSGGRGPTATEPLTQEQMGQQRAEVSVPE